MGLKVTGLLLLCHQLAVKLWTNEQFEPQFLVLQNKSNCWWLPHPLVTGAPIPQPQD